MKQTTRINGKRVVITTSAKGKVTVKPADVLEEDMQAAQVAALRRLPEYGKRFIFAADMNSERRSPRMRAKAIRTGMTAGEPDLRLYCEGGRLLSVENKAKRTPVSKEQKARHKALEDLGFTVVVLRSESEQEAVEKIIKELRKFWVDVV